MSVSGPTEPFTSLIGHKGAVHTAKYNTGSSYVLTGGQDRTIRLWNPKSGSQIKVYSGHGYEVLDICCSHDNAKFASCGGDRSVFLWDVPTGNTLKKYQGHTGKVNAVAFSADTSIMASGGFDTSVRLWDLKSQAYTPLQILKEATDSVTSVLISDYLIVTGSVDGYTRTYDIRQGELRTDFFDQPVTSVKLSADKAMLLVSTLDSTIRTLDMENGQLFHAFKGHKNTDYKSVSTFGYRENTVIAGDEDGKLFRWNVETGEIMSQQLGHERAVLSVAQHSTEPDFITSSADASVKVWKIKH